MKHRRHKAMRFEKLLWITKGAASRVGFLSNKYTPSQVGAFMHVLALELPQLSM